MRTMILAAAILGMFAATSVSRADDDNDHQQPGADWMSEQQIRDKAKALNLDVQRVSVDDGDYKVDARDNNGRRVDVHFDPRTGAEVSNTNHH